VRCQTRLGHRKARLAGPPKAVAATLAIIATMWSVSSAAAAAAAPTFDAAVFPGATRFGVYEGDPASAAAFRDGELIGYVFSTQLVVASTGYSGKPLDVMVGIDLAGRIAGAHLVEHHEPILVIGVRDQDLDAFVAQYRGRDVRDPIEVVQRTAAGTGQVDAITGATVSSVVLNDSILRAARAIARSRGILDGDGARLDLDRIERANWLELIADGSVARRHFKVKDAQEALSAVHARYGPPGASLDPGATFLDLYYALATPARIGRNLLGDHLYNRLAAQLREGDQVIFIAARGLYSFKGTAWVRQGAFDRFQIVQNGHVIQLTAADHVRVDKLAVDDAPDLREQAAFLVRQGSGFDPISPWRLDVRVEGDRADGSRESAKLSATYVIPEAYVLGDVSRETADEPLWVRQWRARSMEIAVLVVALVILSAALFFQDAVVRRRLLYDRFRLGFLIFTLLWLGWYAGAQLSVINVLTFADSLMTTFRWEVFLLEPLIFILWSYVAVTLLFWGRGVFCGWLCPFGALQELSNRVGQLLRIPQIDVPFGLHERVWPIKYVAFLALFALSIGGVSWLHAAAEIEPFKTAIILGFDRAWPYVLYPVGLIIVGLFVNRFFCRYVCPLGAALALPARMRMFEWLKRRWQCGLQCNICAQRCPVQAIHPEGRINPNECIHCLSCQMLYHDDQTCPPLVERRKRRDSRLTRRLVERFEAAEADGNATKD